MAGCCFGRCGRWIVGVFLCRRGLLFETGVQACSLLEHAAVSCLRWALVGGREAALLLDPQSFPPNHRHYPKARTGLALG